MRELHQWTYDVDAFYVDIPGIGEVELPGGNASRADASVFWDPRGRTAYVVLVDEGLPYVSVDAFSVDADDDAIYVDNIGGEFLQEWRVEDTLGPQWSRMTHRTILKRLM